MIQKVLLGILFIAAVMYVGRMLYRQVTAPKDSEGCDKCLPKEKSTKEG